MIKYRNSVAHSGRVRFQTEDIQTSRSTKGETQQPTDGTINTRDMDINHFDDQMIPISLSPIVQHKNQPRNDDKPSSSSEISFGESFDSDNHIDLMYMYDVRFLPASKKSYHLEATLGTRTIGDKYEPRPCGICFVRGITVVLDFNSHKLKTFKNWRKSNLHFEYINLPFKSRSITKISPSIVAVTGPSAREICLIQIWPRLKLLSKVSTKKRYISLACTAAGTLTGLFPGRPCSYARETRYSPCAMDTIDYKGSVVSSMQLTGTYSAHSISETDIITLVVAGSKRLICLNWNGIQLYEIDLGVKSQDIRSLYSYFGDIFVPDFDRNIISVFHKTGEDAAFELTTINGVQQPMDIHAEADGTLFVACWDGYVRKYSLNSRVETTV